MTSQLENGNHDETDDSVGGVLYETLSWRKSDDDEGSFNTGLVKYFDQLIHPTINLDKDTTDELISKCVLLTEDWEEIEKQASATMRNAKLLRILIARPFDTVKIFLDALIESDHKNIYSGKLVSDMKKYIHEEYSTYPKYFGDDNVSDHKVKLQKNYKFLVEKTDNTFVCDHLFASRVISFEEKEEICHSSLTTNGRNRRLLGKLLRKDIIAYNALLEAYRMDTEYIDIAELIEQTEVTEHDKRMIQTGIEARRRRIKVVQNEIPVVRDNMFYSKFMTENKDSEYKMTEMNAENLRCFHDITRSEADTLLSDKRIGSYILRHCSKPGVKYAVSLKTDTGVVHIKLLCSGGKYSFESKGPNDYSYDTIYDVVKDLIKGRQFGKRVLYATFPVSCIASPNSKVLNNWMSKA